MNVKVRGIVRLEHRIGNIRHVHPSIRLSGDVHFLVLKVEGVCEILVEAHEAFGDFFLAGFGADALRESGADGLLNPEHVAEVYPGPWVLHWLKRTILPKKRAVFLEKAFKRRAAGTSLEQV